MSRPARGNEKNPVTVAVLREYFSDDRWRTVYDMAVRLTDFVPPEVAVRAVLDRPNVAERPLQERIMSGTRKLVYLAVSAALARGTFEARPGKHGRQYRYVARADTAPRAGVVGDPVPPEAYTRPAGTKSGITRAMVHQLIRDNPGIELDELIVKLGACIKLDAVSATRVRAMVKADVRRGLTQEAAEARVCRMRDGDQEGFTLATRRWAVANVLSHLVKGGNARAVRTIRYYAQP